MQIRGRPFTAIVQLGPIVASAFVFRRKIRAFLADLVKNPNPRKLPTSAKKARLAWLAALGTLPIIGAGWALESRIETSFRRLDVIGWSLISLGLVMMVAQVRGAKHRSINDLSPGTSLGIGFLQVFALVPGVSRSGITLSGAFAFGFDAKASAQLSLLFGIPAITAAGLFKFAKVARHGMGGQMLGPSLLGALVAGFVAYFVLAAFVGFVDRFKLWPFIVYRVALGSFILLLLHFHRMVP
jgi:undecaprenyl-diphosphatase